MPQLCLGFLLRSPPPLPPSWLPLHSSSSPPLLFFFPLSRSGGGGSWTPRPPKRQNQPDSALKPELHEDWGRRPAPSCKWKKMEAACKGGFTFAMPSWRWCRQPSDPLLDRSCLKKQMYDHHNDLFHFEDVGKICYTWFGPYPRVIVSNLDMIRDILSNKFGHFEKPQVNPLGELLVTGLVAYEGDKWAKHRRIINPAFHVEKLKRMLPAFSTCCVELIARWENMVGPNRSCELDVWPELQNFSGDVISRTAFGSSFEEGRRIFQLQAEQAELLIQGLQNIFIPGYRFFPTKRNRRMKEIAKEVRGLLRNMIMKREKAMKSSITPNDDLLSLLLESNLKYYKENGSLEKFKMTIEDVIEECKLFYFAGQETTSDLLTWTMVVLSMHPSWQARAREEVLQVFGKAKPDFDSLSQLKVVTMILYEVLRLYPPAVFLLRSTYKTMELGGFTFPAGVHLILPILSIHHDPTLWGEDANEFNPERFAEGVSKASKHQMAFMPFGGGPRICVGQNFAMTEVKLGLAMILQHFSFELAPSYRHAPYTVITLQPQHGAQLILHKL